MSSAFSESFPGRGDASVTNDANAGARRVLQSVRRRAHQPDHQYRFRPDRGRSAARQPDAFSDRSFRRSATSFSTARRSSTFRARRRRGNSLLPYFSRRIGLDANGSPQKIDVGGKLGGQFGTNDVGALYVRTGEEDYVAGEDFAVLPRRSTGCSVSRTSAGSTPGARARGSPTRPAEYARRRLSCSPRRRSAGSDNLSVGGFFVNTSTTRAHRQEQRVRRADRLSRTIPGAPNLLYREIQDELQRGRRVHAARRLPSPEQRPARTRRGRPAVRGSASVQYGISADFQRDSESTTACSIATSTSRWCNVATHSQDTFAVHVLPTLRAAGAQFHDQPGHHAAGGERVHAATRYQLSGPDRAAAHGRDQPDLRGRHVLRRHAAPHRAERQRPPAARGHHLHDRGVEPGRPGAGQLQHAPVPHRAGAAVQPLDRLGQQHPVRHAERRLSAGSRASGGF